MVKMCIRDSNNTEQNTSRFSNVSAAYMQVAGADPVVCGSGGDAATYYTPYEKPVVSEISFQCTTGRPSHPVFPYYNLKIGEGGMFIAVGWPGNYFWLLYTSHRSVRRGGQAFRAAGMHAAGDVPRHPRHHPGI